MKSKIVILCMFFIGSFLACKKDKSNNDQLPEGQLSKVVYKQEQGYFRFIKSLPNGNVVAVGQNEDSIKFGNNTYYPDGRALFLVVYDKSGNVVKSRMLDLPSYQYFVDADVAPDGSIYVAFEFTETINIGSGNLTSNGSVDICIARFSSNLETLNAFSYGSSINDFSCNISVGKNNDLFIIDEMRDEFSLHGIPVSILSGRSTLVVMKVNSTLNSSTFKTFSGNASTSFNPSSVVVDENSNVYFTGNFIGKVYFGDIAQFVSGNYKTFLVKLNASLETQWDFAGSGSGGSSGQELAIDVNQNLYLLNSIEGEIDWLEDNYNLGVDGNILQYIDTDGNVKWTKKFAGIYNYSYSKLTTTKNRVALDLGKVAGNITIGRGGPPFSDLIVLDNLGNTQWRKSFEPTSSSFPYVYIGGICFDSDGRIWLCGEMKGKFDFNNNGSAIDDGNFSEDSYKNFILKY
jgi:hypothetical protein